MAKEPGHFTPGKDSLVSTDRKQDEPQSPPGQHTCIQCMSTLGIEDGFVSRSANILSLHRSIYRKPKDDVHQFINYIAQRRS
jgi:hypothetical protein